MTPGAPHRRDAADPAPVSRRYQLRWPSFVYIATALFLAVGAVNSQNNLLYWAFGAAVCGVIISGLVSGSTMLALRVTRDPPATPHVGEQLTLAYAVRNRHRFLPAFAVLIEELGSDPAGRAPPPGLAGRPAALAHCAARGRARASTALDAVRRGPVELRYVRMSSSFPFGLVRKSVTFDLPTQVLVVPAVLPARGLERRVRTRASRAVSGTRAMNPDGVEFFGIAEYRPGDPLAKIAWKRSAALGTMVVRRTASSMPARPWVVLGDDVAAAAEWEREVAITAAASVADHLARQGAAVGLSVPWAGITIAPTPGQRSVHRMLRALATLGSGSAARRGPSGPGAGDEVIAVGVSGRTGQSRVNAIALESWLAPGAALPAPLRPPAPPPEDAP